MGIAAWLRGLGRTHDTTVKQNRNVKQESEL